MGKRSKYQSMLLPLLSNDLVELERFLVSNSNLPGTRANLELAWAFADTIDGVELKDELFELLTVWINEEGVLAGNPREFLPFCALQGLGSAYSSSPRHRKAQIITTLKNKAGDSRWRIREAVAMGFQRIAEQDFDAAKRVFTDWLEGSSPADKRAVLAALAHAPLLKDENRARFCLGVAEEVLRQVQEMSREERKSEEFRILRQGMGYTLSLFVENLPQQGFACLKRWAEQDDLDVKRIIRSNLGKARLAKKYANLVQEVLAKI